MSSTGAIALNPSVSLAQLVPAAARCWRAARDRGVSAQQRLHALLAGQHGDMLAPVFDSLMTLCEAALGRRIAVGGQGGQSDAGLSEDESLLLGLLDGSRQRRACLACAEGAASALDCAICSTRIMMTLANAQSPAPPASGRERGSPSRRLG